MNITLCRITKREIVGPRLFLLLFIVLLLLPAEPLFAAAAAGNDGDGSEANPYRIPLADGQIKLDGILDEALWDDAFVVELNYEVSPGENTQPPVRTEAYLVHSRGYLYVGFKAFDPDPAAIRAYLSDRDETYGQDAVTILLDTFNDELRAFEFECNALGIQRDAMRNDASRGHFHGWGDESWDVIWDSAGVLTNWGYSVEMAIPFNSLSFPRTSAEQTWGFIVTRDYPRNVRYSFRNVPDDRNRNCSICQAAKIVGFENISPGRNLEINPTITSFRHDEREDFPDGELVKENAETELGLTTSWGITPNFSLEMTVNPDFSQVEADAYQLEINRQFALRFEEKRPFFLEGRDFFSTSLEAVYTRSIIDPSWGVKLTGKEGANALGLYVTRDEVTHLIFPGNQESDSFTFEMESTANVFRYRRDMFDNSTIGMLVTDREGDGYYNRLYGFDGQLRLSSTDTVTFQALGSNTKYNKPLFQRLIEESEEDDDDDDEDEEDFISPEPDGSFSDWAGELRYEHRTRNWDAMAGYSRLGEGFRADLGYISRVGFQRFMVDMGRTWYGDSSDPITRFRINSGIVQINDMDGDLLERDVDFASHISGPMQSEIMYRFGAQRERYEGLVADLYSHMIRPSFRPVGWMEVELDFSFGDAIDYSEARKGSKWSFEPELGLNLGRHLKLDFEHEYTRMSLEQGRLYLANISQLRAVYQFNPKMFFRTILQYIDIRRNQALYTDEIDPLYKRLFTQLLFAYKLNPRTVLFLGYGDSYEGYQDISLTQYDRAFFMKIGYAWVL